MHLSRSSPGLSGYMGEESTGKPGVIHNMVGTCGEQVGEQVESTAKQGGRIYTTEDFTGILKPLNLNNIKDIAQ